MKYLVFLFILSSCYSTGKKSGLRFTERIQREVIVDEVISLPPAEDQEELLREIELLKEKFHVWQEITKEANDGLSEIWPLVTKKCLYCHNKDRPLTILERPNPTRNPIRIQLEKGISALDFSSKFPLMAKGNPSQLAILNSLKSTILDKSMPPKSYTLLFPWKKLRVQDQQKLINWIDPLIERLEEFDQTYVLPFEEEVTKNKVQRVFQLKCVRCHGNGNSKGGFGNIENLDELYYKSSKCI